MLFSKGYLSPDFSLYWLTKHKNAVVRVTWTINKDFLMQCKILNNRNSFIVFNSFEVSKKYGRSNISSHIK